MEISGRPCRKKSSWYMMNVSERQKMETINTPYDDTFRTLLQDCPELVVPLINELFGTNYTGREVVVSNENEIFLRNPEGKKEKRVTDSNLTLISLKGISKRYHLECQSTVDGTMEIRMWEYDAQIALMNKEYRDGVLYVKFFFIVFEEQRDSCFPCDSCVQIKLFPHFNFDSIIAHYSVENKY